MLKTVLLLGNYEGSIVELRRVVRRQVSEDSVHVALSKDIHPVVDRLLRHRGVYSVNEVDYALKHLLPFHALSNITAAACCLAEALEKQEKILIVGDFDADGATSTALSVRVLRAFGARNVDFLVPNRFNFGYGLTTELVAVAKNMQPDLIMTVDNGISSIAGVAAAKAAGIKVLITDHHLSPAVLPDADVIVNPNQREDEFESKALAGVGVVFYVMLALRAELRKRNWFEQQKIVEPNLANYLDIVALGTVADVVPLDRNNRILVAQGLQRIRAGKCVPGIAALLSIAKRIPKNLHAQDLGFLIGPRLNAAGRMDDMSLGIECLITDDPVQAMSLAKQLDQFNQERRVVEQDMQLQALQTLKQISLGATKTLPLGLCLFDASWHQGVIGILASRIKDKTHRPVIAFAKDNDTTIKGSARSIAGVNIRDILVEVDTDHPGLIIKFGGHAMAAGLSLLQSNLQKFSAAFNVVLAKHVNSSMLEKIVVTDGELRQEDFTLRFAEILQEYGPWGQQFPEPMFDGRFQVVDENILAGKYMKFTLLPENSESSIEAVAFNIDLEQWAMQRCEVAHVVYRLDINEFRERRKLQLIIEQIEPISMMERI
ncbi:MAG: single-stranded-DNA-specific exonuclease RecJ [Gammaproteobacteria bacterium]|nr:single-stranded-DNA-specific exonuclease RecJ [Gammaproteobacteria bacterium]